MLSGDYLDFEFVLFELTSIRCHCGPSGLWLFKLANFNVCSS